MGLLGGVRRGSAVVCCTIGLATGPLWAKPVWGIWWTWDARLTTTFILWLLYISYLLLRGLLDDPEKKATLSAVFGILAFLDVSTRLRFQPPVAHAAPAARDSRRQRFGLDPGDGQSSASLRDRSNGSHDCRSVRSIPARAASARIRRIAVRS